MKLRALVALSAVLAASLAVGCGGSGEEAGGRTLNWFVFNEPSGSFAEAAEQCSQQSGGRYEIQFQFLPSDADAQREQLVRRLGAEDSSIDIMGMDVIWTAEFANAGWVEEWTGERRQQATDGVFDSVIETATFEDKLYAAPYTSNTQLLWYREDRVDQAPETWEEMLQAAEEIGPEKGKIQVQANRYEGLTVWVVAMIASAGGSVLEGDTQQVALAPEPTQAALRTIAEVATSPFADPGIDTSTEDSGRLAFEDGGSSFMVNYPFVFPSAKENAPEVFENMGSAKYPAVVEGEPSAPPLGGINLGISTFSKNKELAFEAAECIRQPENQITAASKGGLPPTNSDVYDRKEIQEAYPGFADLIKTSIEDSTPRPTAVAYQDLSLAIQRVVHPTSQLDPDNIEPTYEDLVESVKDAAQVEGLL